MRSLTMSAFVRLLAFVGLLALGLVVLADIGSAQYRGPGGSPGGSTSPAPAPLLGLGLPLAAGAIAALAIARRFRRKR